MTIGDGSLFLFLSGFEAKENALDLLAVDRAAPEVPKVPKVSKSRSKASESGREAMSLSIPIAEKLSSGDLEVRACFAHIWLWGSRCELEIERSIVLDSNRVRVAISRNVKVANTQRKLWGCQFGRDAIEPDDKLVSRVICAKDAQIECRKGRDPVVGKLLGLDRAQEAKSAMVPQSSKLVDRPIGVPAWHIEKGKHLIVHDVAYILVVV